MGLKDCCRWTDKELKAGNEMIEIKIIDEAQLLEMKTSGYEHESGWLDNNNDKIIEGQRAEELRSQHSGNIVQIIIKITKDYD